MDLFSVNSELKIIGSLCLVGVPGVGQTRCIKSIANTFWNNEKYFSIDLANYPSNYRLRGFWKQLQVRYTVILLLLSFFKRN